MPDPSDPIDAVLDLLPTPAVRIGPDFRHRYANPAYLRARALGREQVVGRSFAEVGFGEGVRLEYERRAGEVFATGRPAEYDPADRFPGGPRPLKMVLVPLPGPDGRPAEVLAVGTDPGAVGAAEAARLDAETTFGAFMRHLPATAWMKDADGRYTMVNPAVEQQFGLPADRWLGRTDFELFPGPVAAPLVENDRQVLATGAPLRVQEESIGAQGETRTYLSIKFPVADSAGRRFVGGAALDITAQKELEERQAETARLLQSQKLESLGVLAGGIAHDFNNLLTTVLGYTSFAKMEIEGGDPAAAVEYLGKVEAGARRAGELCRQMLAYAGRAQFSLKAADLNALVEEMGQLVAASVSKRVVLRYVLDPALPAVRCDATQVRQVVMNLITNASDAIGEKSGVVTVTTGLIDADAEYLTEIGAAHLHPRRYAYLEVSDTGCGMPEDVQARIFEPFYTTKFTGRGLGLSAVLGIIRGHGGAIKLYSQVGRGTTFKVLLPTADDPAHDSGATPVPTFRAAFGRGRAVLVIDDEEDVRVLARKLLTRAGFAVEVAEHGLEGVDRFRIRPDDFVLVLCDLTMPKLDGAGTFRELRLTRKDVRVILTSGFAAEEATAGFEGKGLAGFLRKPFAAEELLQAVYEVVGQ